MLVYGFVWVNRFDMAYAIGVLMRLIFDVSFADACNDSGIPVANSPDSSNPNAPTINNWELEIFENFLKP